MLFCLRAVRLGPTVFRSVFSPLRRRFPCAHCERRLCSWILYFWVGIFVAGCFTAVVVVSVLVVGPYRCVSECAFAEWELVSWCVVLVEYECVHE